MDAQLFQEVYDALQNHTCRIKIPLSNSCPITRITWSTFDFMSGPILRFVWEADFLNGQKPTCAESVDETDGNVSTDSSFSKNTHGSDNTIAKSQFEDIDDVFKSEFISDTTDDDVYFPFSEFGAFNNSENNTTLKAATSTETSSSFTTINNNTFNYSSYSTLDGNGNRMRPSTSAVVFDQSSSHSKKENEKHNDFDKCELNASNEFCQDVSECTVMSDSCMDSGIAATTSMESDLSSQCGSQSANHTQPHERPSTSASFHPKSADLQIRYRVGLDDCNINVEFPKRPPRAKFVQDLGYCEEAIEEDQEEICRPRETFSRLTQSELSSSVMNTSSALFVEDEVSISNRNKMETAKMEFFHEAEMFNELNSTGGSDCGIAMLSDEEFVSKFVLAEQICSPPLPASPLLHKLTTIPSRRIVVGSYIFVLKRDDAVHLTKTSAISVILPLEMTNWYMERQQVVEEYFTDMISRFKAAYYAESIEDVVCRATREFTTFFDLFAALERWPLTHAKFSHIKIQLTYFWDTVPPEPTEMNFLAKAITACLMTKGMCTVVGADPKQLLKMMRSLSFFVEESQRLFCLRPYHSTFSSYLRIQAVRRTELPDIYLSAFECHWPLSIIDLDRKSVTYSGSFFRHRTMKRRNSLFQVGQILKETGMELNTMDEKRCTKGFQVEPQVVRADGAVLEFLDKLFLLPLKSAARFAYIDHFHLCLENRARALLRYVEDVSAPSPGDKRSALSAPWNVTAARRALNLQFDSAFAISLAKADCMEPNFAEFYYQTAVRRVNRHGVHQYGQQF